MPIYDFQCPTCQVQDPSGPYQFEAYVPTIGEAKACDRCAGPTERIWSFANQHRGASAFPYITTNLTADGSPVEVRSERHLADLCKKHGKTHRPDNGWIEKKWVGYDPVTRRQVYTEGSGGRGMKGSWF